MRKWVAILVFFMVAAWVNAQSVGLKFDPKWKLPVNRVSFFSLLNEMMTPPQVQHLPLPQAWCYNDLAFFCKIEVKMEKAVRFPIKFRLGDVQYVDRLEGKRSGF